MLHSRGTGIPTPPVWSDLALLSGILAVVVIVTYAFSASAGEAAMLGSITFIMPQAYLTFRVFQHIGARQAKKIVQSFYRGVVGKFVLTSMMIALILVMHRQINVFAYFATFGLSWLANTVLTARSLAR